MNIPVCIIYIVTQYFVAHPRPSINIPVYIYIQDITKITTIHSIMVAPTKNTFHREIRWVWLLKLVVNVILHDEVNH